MNKRDIELLKKELAEKRKEIEFLSTDKAYGVLTRPAVELRLKELQSDKTVYFVYADLDRFKAVNDKYGKAGANGRVFRALLSVRQSDVVISGRWFSGDELVFAIRGDPVAFANRLQKNLKAEGLSATIAVVRSGRNYLSSLLRADAAIMNAKQAGWRGSVISLLSNQTRKR